MNKSISTKELTLLGILMALTCVVTMMVTIPMPMTKGYVNPGDVIVLASALLLGRKRGALVGGVGSAMADLFLGYTHYVPVTLIVKGLEAYLCGAIFEKTKNPLIAVVPSGLWMALGYFLFEGALMYGFTAAWASVPGNVGQGVFGMVGGLLLYPILKRITATQALQ